jgi:hypothetical protein
VEQFARPNTDFVPSQTDDAGIARPKHLHADAAAEPELLEAMHMIGVALDAGDASELTRAELLKRNRGSDHSGDLAGKGCKLNVRKELRLSV